MIKQHSVFKICNVQKIGTKEFSEQVFKNVVNAVDMYQKITVNVDIHFMENCLMQVFAF